jgi:hypothetical protein
VIADNTAQNAGGISIGGSSPSVHRCTISRNTSEFGAGGISCGGEDTSPSFTGCIVSDNTVEAGPGGGMLCNVDSSPVITNCIFSGNYAETNGGGLCFDWWSCPVITNCTITGNASSREHGGGIFFSDASFAIMRNCILWDNYPEEIGGSPFGELHITYSDIEGWWSGEGNINMNPRFVSWRGFDYLLHPDSPCIDSGDPSIEDRLYEWHPKWPGWYPDGARSDMGAYGGPGNWKWVR